MHGYVRDVLHKLGRMQKTSVRAAGNLALL
jgi:hypothetical protein